ncbi:MAG: type-F conjugative transfer system protein TraW [Alphaproteobacteria bacterium]|nr:type-F conjugative transfer system protein TraW [Alphaproteobacteria bacterium]
MKTLCCLLTFQNTALLIAALQSLAMAKDFGVHSHAFEIQEPDLLKQMEHKLQRLEQEGKLADLNEKMLERTKKVLFHPQPVAGITKATQARTFTYDPSIVVPYDLKDHEGRVFHRAGTKINPLHTHSLSSLLVFLDGEDKAQVNWVEKTYLQIPQHPKIILTSGSPFQLMEQWEHRDYPPVYFDQGGKLTKKLGIHHVPAVVVQEGLKLKISEIVVQEETP